MLPSANRIDISVSQPASLIGKLNKGYFFITYGGLIIDCHDIDSLMAAGGGSFTIPDIPGGTAANPLAGAYYGVSVFGWGTGEFASGSQFLVDLTSGNRDVSITMTK
jgi:hypothetical protein